MTPPGRSRAAFTLVEVIIALVVFSMTSMLALELIIRENRQTVELTEDLAANKEARYFFQLISKDIRSAKEIVLPEPEQRIGASTDPETKDWIRMPPDESKSRLMLRYPSASGDRSKVQIDWWLVSRIDGRPTIPRKTVAVRNARFKPFTPSAGLHPLIRSVSAVDSAGNVTLMDDSVVGHVRGLAFYQIADPAPTNVAPTVYFTLVVSAFKRLPSGNVVEGYRDVLRGGFTARGIVAAAAGPVPAGDPAASESADQ
jgi:prepilin-type N-terminal cleavage/methylation domain-containing protein